MLAAFPKLMAQLGDLIDLDAKTIYRRPLRESVNNRRDSPVRRHTFPHQSNQA